MPTISIFYGILIRMFFHDTDKHHVPHIHAEYQGQVAVYAIENAVLAGGLPLKKSGAAKPQPKPQRLSFRPKRKILRVRTH
uniref:DUF4160 domain-containing protein n=1 Tax=Candidatus Kentrum sp. FW TaxID=2126338 RepID=A0A450U2Y2_9GAMM|nr:MAG: protein of unknown function (DUF4160) [Candidatus Kentron sp. FW]